MLSEDAKGMVEGWGGGVEGGGVEDGNEDGGWIEKKRRRDCVS